MNLGKGNNANQSLVMYANEDKSDIILVREPHVNNTNNRANNILNDETIQGQSVERVKSAIYIRKESRLSYRRLGGLSTSNRVAI